MGEFSINEISSWQRECENWPDDHFAEYRVEALSSRTVNFAVMRQTVLVYSAIALALLVLFSLRKWSWYAGMDNRELWAAVFGLAFIGAGILLSRVLFRNPRTQADAEPGVDPDKIRELGITQREYEVLQLIAAGHSNQEIAKTLFISESTVKTHASNLLTKLNASRRTQAVLRARQLRIL